jgi:hypothetical protein
MRPKENGMSQFTEAMRQAIDASPSQPAHCTDPATGQHIVLLASADFDWIRQMLGDEADAVRVRDLRTNQDYAVLMPERYERFKAFFEEDPLSPAERAGLLRAAGKRAGWDKAAFDELDTQASP